MTPEEKQRKYSRESQRRRRAKETAKEKEERLAKQREINKRQNTGRPSGAPTIYEERMDIRKTISVTQKQSDYITALGGGKFAPGIRKLIEAQMNKEK